jgi:hypothetical protein
MDSSFFSEKDESLAVDRSADGGTTFEESLTFGTAKAEEQNSSALPPLIVVEDSTNWKSRLFC